MKKHQTFQQPDGVRMLAWLMLVVFSSGILFPGTSYAGGPGQPEASGFTPIGVSDMVDPFTGDFTYNIPLMDIEGYPINIAYQSGITMDQEASWVGLGWNLNVGSVVRNMRGVPDDFNGDEIVKVTHMRPNRTYSVNGNLGVEIFGSTGFRNPTENVDPPSLSMSLGFGYNNYTGYSTHFSISPSFDLTKSNDHNLVAGFSLSGSSENGASFAPSFSFSKNLDKPSSFDRKLIGNIGSSFNSRAGLSYISYGVGIARKEKSNEAYSRIDKMNSGTLADGAPGSFDLGLASYSPSANNPMRNMSITGKWKAGSELTGASLTGDIGFTYSSQWIPKDDEELRSKAYGYFHLGAGQRDEHAILDFNRDNDGSYTKETPFIASAHLTNDLYSLNAQGITGSYRGFRNDVGYVFDPAVKTISSSGSVGIETGLGNFIKFGLDLAYNRTSAETGGWTQNENHVRPNFEFKDDVAAPVYEFYAMQEANERSVNQDPLFTGLGGPTAMYFPMSGLALSPKLENVLKADDASIINHPDNRRTLRHKRNQVMQFLTNEELGKGYGINNKKAVYMYAQPYHIGEIIQTGTDGRRYVFGIAAYNHFQEEVTFATGKRIDGDDGLAPADYFSGLISYASAGTAPSVDNEFGLDNYYSYTRIPAHAHSYLLTAVLSDDYIDSDGERGPSQNDQGTYVKFDYDKKVATHKWRTPVARNEAFRNEGMKVDKNDDKASYVYGEKDLWYIDTIQTKNYIAVFKTEPRSDGFSVIDKHGGLDNDTNNSQRLLRKISLYSKADYLANGSSAKPIQEVHFVYNYDLCQGFPGNPGGLPANDPDTEGNGKLTLKKIYFTYQGSNKMKLSPYTFDYDKDFNREYHMKSVDRWGNYKPSPEAATVEDPKADPLNNADFPYTDQDPSHTNEWVASWSLTGIHLPSGGYIAVEYESDDYAFVQNKKAMRMFPIAYVQGEDGEDLEDANMTGVQLLAVSDEFNKNRKIYFRMEYGHDDIADYVSKGEYMYFRCLTSFTEASENTAGKYEFVSGYGKVSSAKPVERSDGFYGEIILENEKLLDNGSDVYSPIAKTAIQFGRMHLSRFINDVTGLNTDPNDTEQGFADFAGSVAGAVGSLGELFTGPNIPIWKNERGTQILTQQSFIRLTDPTGHKLGGGSRVKSIKMSDNWDQMSGMDKFEYGQEFSYVNEDGTSSGVASYEPQAGGDENPWHKPVPYANKLRFSPDENLYLEEPIMESLFPSPSVGYSRVVIKDIKPSNVVRTGTGKVVKEFYTAKDFPTITERTDADPKIVNSFLPLLPKYQYVTVSQGFSIQLNDMHGKPKSEAVYAENKKTPISTVKYDYKQFVSPVDGSVKLDNMATVIYPNGTSGTAEIGVKYEAVADFRQSNTQSIGGAIQGNVETFYLGVIPLLLPTAWPSLDISSNKFRSAGFTKVVNRFGILERTTANQDGSIVETNNLAYDSETGEVLLTQTKTNFNDEVFSMNYPAYWGYAQLGGAYQNIGVKISDANLNTAGYMAVTDAPKYFSEGDELELYTYNYITAAKGWVSAVSSTGINVIDAAGSPIEMTDVTVKVIRSGRKNKQSASMASLTTLENPMTALSTNKYNKVLNAGAIEFGQDWKTYCNCYSSEDNLTSNPFVLGIKGNWRPVKSYTYLSERLHSNENKNSNIRKDGVFTAYSPYYKNLGGRWKEDGLNWTYVSEVTEFSPNGMTLETKDALNRFSATTFGFNNTLTTAVAANTKLTQLAFASFEDVDYTNCADAHFTIPGTVQKTDAHTGRNSLRVFAGTPAEYNTSISGCTVLTCEDLKLDFVSSNTELHQEVYNILNGNGPYQLEVNVISGSAEASISGNQLTVTGTSYHKVQVTITDSKGCKLVTYIHN